MIPSLTNYESLCLTILDALGFPEYKKTDLVDQERIIREALAKFRVLLVIDNLETVEDERVFRFLKDLPEPCKALVTSRKRLGEVERIVQLREFTPEEANELLRVEMSSKQVSLPSSDAAFARIYKATGGIPLAMKLMVGWMAQGDSLEAAERRTGQKGGDLLEFCFAESYSRFMDDVARLAFSIFPILPEKASLEQVEAATGLARNQVEGAIAKLRSLSLLNEEVVESDEGEPATFYSMLPLTAAFALSILERDRGREKDARKRIARYFEYHKKTQDALEQYGAALQDLGGQTETGRTAALLSNLALATYQRGNLRRARNLFEQAVRTDPHLSYAFQMWATVERQQGNHAKANELFRRATELNPNNPVIWSSWAMMKRDEGDLVSAELYLEKALGLRFPPDPFIVTQLAIVRGQRGKFAESLKTASDAVRESPTTADDRLFNSSLLFSESEAAFRWGMKLLSEDDPAGAVKRFGESLEYLEKLQRIGAGDHRVSIQERKIQRHLGVALRSLGKPAEALHAWERALWDPPRTPLDLRHNLEVDLMRAETLDKLGKKTELIDLCRTAFARYRESTIPAIPAGTEVLALTNPSPNSKPCRFCNLFLLCDSGVEFGLKMAQTSKV